MLSFNKVSLAISHKLLTSLSAKGVPIDNFDNHASKSVYVFSAFSGFILVEAELYRTAAGIAGGGGGGAAPEPPAFPDDGIGDDDSMESFPPELPPLETEVDVASGSISMI